MRFSIPETCVLNSYETQTAIVGKYRFHYRKLSLRPNGSDNENAFEGKREICDAEKGFTIGNPSFRSTLRHSSIRIRDIEFL